LPSSRFPSHRAIMSSKRTRPDHDHRGARRAIPMSVRNCLALRSPPAQSITASCTSPPQRLSIL
jgi:hypothetical protein